MILRFDKMSDMLPQEKARLAAEFLKAAKRKLTISMKIRDSAKKRSFMRNKKQENHTYLYGYEGSAVDDRKYNMSV